MDVKEILLIFCQYGFRKASMEDIAKAAGLSRQSIYKKFGSKEGVFEWAVRTAVIDSHEDAMDALNDQSLAVKDRLVEAFDRWMGSFVPILRGTPHGSEILDMATELVSDGGVSADADFYDAIEEALLQTDLVRDREEAADKTFVLAQVGKGLLLHADTQENFRRDMMRAITTLTSH